MGTDRLVLNSNNTKYSAKCGTVTVVHISGNTSPKFVKSQLVKRTSSDLKQSRVPAYSYLIP